MENKEVGIVIDSYKLLDYKKELETRGFKNFTLFAWKEKPLITIKVRCQADEISIIHEMCEKLEKFYKARQN